MILKRFLAGLIDIIIVTLTAYFLNLFVVQNLLNITDIDIKKDIIKFINGFVVLFYLGLIPYFKNFKTLGEMILKIEPRINVKDIESKLNLTKKVELFNNNLNLKIEKFVYTFAYRLIKFLLDIFGISLILGLFKIIKYKFKHKKDKGK